MYLATNKPDRTELHYIPDLLDDVYQIYYQLFKAPRGLTKEEFARSYLNWLLSQHRFGMRCWVFPPNTTKFDIRKNKQRKNYPYHQENRLWMFTFFGFWD